MLMQTKTGVMQMMGNNDMHEVDEMEKEAKFHIIRIGDEEADEDEKHRILAEFSEELSEMFDDFCRWLKDNSESDKAAARMEKLRIECELLILKTKRKFAQITANESVCKGIRYGKDGALKAGELISEGIDKFKANEQVQKVAGVLYESSQRVVQDERIQEGVKTLKHKTLDAADTLYASLRHFLSDKNDTTDHND